MKRLKTYHSEEYSPATCTTGHTYDIPVSDGIISNHPTYVRPGDHVNWNVGEVVPGTLTFDISGYLFGGGITWTTIGTRQVRISGLNVNVAAGTSVTYRIKGTRYLGGGSTTVAFSTAVTTIMVDSSCKPPGCTGCGGRPPKDPERPRRPRLGKHPLVVTPPV
jgi:hypothetical protein